MPEKKFWKVSLHLPVKDVKEAVEWYKQNPGLEKSDFTGIQSLMGLPPG